MSPQTLFGRFACLCGIAILAIQVYDFATRPALRVLRVKPITIDIDAELDKDHEAQ